MTTANYVFEDDDRPWESSGAVRRDCAPHRAHLIRLLVKASEVCAALSICIFGLPAALGLVIAAIAQWMANSDVKKMAAGLMDPNGRTETFRCLQSASAAVGRNLLIGVPLIFTFAGLAGG